MNARAGVQPFIVCLLQQLRRDHAAEDHQHRVEQEPIRGRVHGACPLQADLTRGYEAAALRCVIRDTPLAVCGRPPRMRPE